MIKATIISDKSEIFLLVGDPTKSTVYSTCPVYQIDRLTHTRLQTDRSSARLGLLGLLTTLFMLEKLENELEGGTFGTCPKMCSLARVTLPRTREGGGQKLDRLANICFALRDC